MLLTPFILLFVLLTAIVTVFGYRRYAKPANMLDRLENSTAAQVFPETTTGLEGAPAKGFAKLLESVGRMLPYSPQDIKMATVQLGAAGFRSNFAVYVYSGIKLISCVSLLIGALLVRNLVTANPVNRLMIPIAAAIGGFLLPSFVLHQLLNRRREAIRVALPDVLDLLVISTEAGCALDKAILNVSREFRTFHPVISEELNMVNMEMLAGGSRIEALRNFAVRTGEEELKKLVAILVQTDRFGTSIAEALRTQSDYLRIRRRQLAEERAGKVGVKLVFPIFFFCMPALMVIVAGPGMLQIAKHLLPAMAAVH